MGADALLITTVGHLFSAVVLAGLGLFVLLQNTKKQAFWLFALSCWSSTVFGTFFAIGINLPPSELAYAIWMVNLIDLAIVATYYHFVLLYLGRAGKAKLVIWGMYVTGFVIAGLSILFPHLFLPEVTSKLFTLSYLNAGPLYYAMLAFFSTIFFLATFEWVRAYFRHGENKRQIEYFLFASVLGYGIGPLDFLLVLDIPLSPMYGMFYGAYVLPVAYGILADNLLDIRILFKRALIYSVGIALTAGFLTSLIFLNDLLVESVPWVRSWMVPILAATVAFVAGRLFWFQLVENERVKYEFITVATHKLRTPLTQISWAVRSILETAPSEKVRDITEQIQHSTNRLIELTNILFETTEEGVQEYSYTKERVGLIAETNAVLRKFAPIIENKNITVNLHSDAEVEVMADSRRLASVIEVLLENAISYTPRGGLVQIITYKKGKSATYSMKDTGIGVSPVDQKNIFTRFYRTDAAKRVDTEGIGLGLAMAKSIIEKHRGRIGVESEGEGKGSTFWFVLPAN